MSEPPKKSYSNTVYRCFSSVKPTQHLLDDIGLSETEQRIAAAAFYEEDAEKMNPHQRVMSRSEYAIVLKDIDSKFNPGGWMASRFSDGTWPVLYSAESEKTAIAEKTYHLVRFYKEEAEREVVDVDLAIARLNIESDRLIDLTEHGSLDIEELRSPDFKSYGYCQGIAKRCLEAGAEALRSFSARDTDGFCVPIFDSKIILKDFGIQRWHKAEIDQGKVALYLGDKTFRW